MLGLVGQVDKACRNERCSVFWFVWIWVPFRVFWNGLMSLHNWNSPLKAFLGRQALGPSMFSLEGVSVIVMTNQVGQCE